MVRFSVGSIKKFFSLRSAIKKGEQLTSTGKVSVPTTTGSISVPKSSTIATESKSPTVIRQLGGGGSGGGGSSSGGGSIVPAISQVPSGSIQEQIKQKDIIVSGGETIVQQLQQRDKQFKSSSIEPPKQFSEDLSLGQRVSIVGGGILRDPSKLFAGEGLDLLSKPTAQQAAFTQFSFGTPTEDLPSTGRTVTFGDIQSDIEFSRALDIGAARKGAELKIKSERDLIQRDIFGGGTTLEEGRKQFDENLLKADTQFQSDIEDIFKAQPDVKGITGRRREGLQFGAEIFRDIGLLSTGLTSVTAGASRLKSDPLIIEDIEAIKSGETTIGAQTRQRPSLDTAVFFVGGLAPTASIFSRTGRAIEIGEIQSAKELAKFSQVGERTLVGEGAVDILSGTGKVGRTTAQIDTKLITTKVGDKFLTAGQEDILVTGRRFFSQRPFVTGGTQDISALSSSLPAGSQQISASLSRVKTRPATQFRFEETFFGSKGKIKLFRGTGDITEQLSVGVGVQPGKDLILGVGGKAGLSVDLISGKGFRGSSGLQISAPLQQRTILKIKRQPQFDTGFNFIQPAKITKTPFGKSFGFVGTQQIPSVTQPPIIKPSTQALDLTTTQTNFIPSVGKTITSGVSKTKTRPTQSISSFPPTTLGKAPGLKQLPAVRQAQALFPAQSIIPSQALLSSQAVRQDQALKISQSLKQPQRLRQKSGLEQLSFSIPSPAGLGGLGGFDFGGFILPPPPFLGGERGRGKKAKGKRAKVRIAPSFTGIVLDIREAAIVSPRLGVIPFSIRGLETGIPKSKKRKKKKKK